MLFGIRREDEYLDFVFELKKAIDFSSWSEGNHNVKYINLIPPSDQFIPVGHLDMVLNHARNNNEGIRDPINIPKELRKDKFLRRTFCIEEFSTREELLNFCDEELFFKDLNRYKGVAGKTSLFKNCDFEASRYLVSEVVDIRAEYRAFIYYNNILDIRRYAGCYDVNPDYGLIKEMVSEYKEAPNAYVLDVGVGEETFLIEIQPFVSCGLYGFNEYRFLPGMFKEGYKWLVQKV